MSKSKTKIIPKKDFTGYPGGVETKFQEGVEIPVPSDWIDEAKLREKGLIEKPAR